MFPHQRVTQPEIRVHEMGPIPENRFQHGPISLVEQKHHGRVLLPADVVVYVTKRVIIRKHRAIIFEQQPTITRTGTVKQEYCGGCGTSIRLEVHHILLHGDQGPLCVTTHLVCTKRMHEDVDPVCRECASCRCRGLTGSRHNRPI